MHSASMSGRGRGIRSDEEIKKACIVGKPLRSSTPQRLEFKIQEFGTKTRKTCDATDSSNMYSL